VASRHGERLRIFGIDFTSRPRRGKPVICAACTLRDGCLSLNELLLWSDFAGFEAALRRPGPWIAGMDFPFGQARRLVQDLGWPATWDGYVAHASALGRAGFRTALYAYRAGQPPGDKEHRRAADRAAGAISPQKLYGTPVGLMFFEGAPRLRSAGVTIPGLQVGDPERIVVEAYPGVLAQALIGRRSYKQETKAKQTPEQAQARRDLSSALSGPTFADAYGIAVEAPPELAEDPSGDRVDALPCAIQAAWAWNQRDIGFGLPDGVDPLEGWIADPHVRAP
jgi:hypothetical protein